MSATNSSKWVKGQSSPNPAGRPKSGHAVAEHLRNKMAGDLDEILDSLIAQAKAGDIATAKILLDRAVPSLKPVETLTPLPVPTDATPVQQGEAIIKAVTDGLLAPMQAATLLAALGTLTKLREAEEIEARITALETSAWSTGH